MKGTVRNILEVATRAPSGENAQPWSFLVESDGARICIDVYVSRERDQGLYSWGDRASYVAIGAALENICIFAPTIGFSATINVLPESTDVLHAARILLSPTEHRSDPLSECIFRRSTNRKTYHKDLLTNEEIEQLQAAARSARGSVRFVTDADAIKKLAEAASTNELVMLDNPTMHDFFFSHLNWTRAEEEKRGAGMSLDSLELPAPAKIGFKVMSNWQRARFLNKFLKFNRFAATQNAAVYASAPAFGAIISEDESPASAIAAGRAMQRTWLEAERLGLSMQPMAGILYLDLALKGGFDGRFSAEQTAALRSGMNTIRAVWALNKGLTYFMFRIGRADKPSSYSVRYPIEAVTQPKS